MFHVLLDILVFPAFILKDKVPVAEAVYVPRLNLITTPFLLANLKINPKAFTPTLQQFLEYFENCIFIIRL